MYSLEQEYENKSTKSTQWHITKYTLYLQKLSKHIFLLATHQILDGYSMDTKFTKYTHYNNQLWCVR